jgi:WD40 repeat protein
VELWNHRGEVVADYELKGTTPTITRVYRAGRGTMHDNILKDSPTWAVSAAISRDLRFVTVGGSDSKVRLFDRTAGTTRTLEFAWKYTERRHMGGNPDLNTPVDMRFSPGGDQLVVAYSHGEMITWSTRDGKRMRVLDGRCSPEEATRSVNRYTPPGAPRQVPTEEDRAGCGRITEALFDKDLRSIVTAGAGVRVRRVGSGAGVAFLVEDRLPDQYLTWSPAGTLAMADIYGAIALWSPGESRARLLAPPSPSGPIDPAVTSNGRFLWFKVDRRERVWDLISKKELAPTAGSGEEILAMSSDGKLVARRERGAVLVVEGETGKALVRHPVPEGERAFAQLASRGKKALLQVERYPARSFVVCDLEAARCNPAPFASGDGAWAISEDGRWVAATAKDGALHVLDASSGKLVRELGPHVRDVAFSPDGGAVAWIEQADRNVRHIKARWARLGGAGDTRVHELGVDGWPSDIALSADGSEVWVLTEGSLRRWNPGAGPGIKPLVEIEETDLIGARRIQVSENGKALFLTGYNRIAIRSTEPDLRPLATLYPLLSGGFLVVSAWGAVDGSADAPEQVVTRVTRGGEALVLDGLAGWDAAHVEDVLASACDGQDVATPVAGANGSSATSL